MEFIGNMEGHWHFRNGIYIYHLDFPALLGPRNTYVYVTVFNLLVSFRGEKNRFYKNTQSIYPVVETKQIYTHTSTKK